MPYFNESNLCSAELLDNKFIVPCNPEDYLRMQYGYNWSYALTNNYFNLKTFFFYKYWNEEEYPYSIRLYDNDGNFES